MPEKLLNPYQANSVTLTLRDLEMVLRNAPDELNSHHHGILYRQVTTLSHEQYQKIQQVIEKALAEIAYLATTFSLTAEVEDPRLALLGKLSVLSSDLYDIQAEKLRGYGKVAPGLKEALDPPLNRLSQSVEFLLKVLARK